MLNFHLLEIYFFAKTIEIRGLVCFGIVLRANEYHAREIKLFFNLKQFKKCISFQRN